MISNIETNKSLSHERWGEFFDQFSNSNRGRHILIEVMPRLVLLKQLMKIKFIAKVG
jgi:hypothetical protein